jgi:glucokinase
MPKNLPIAEARPFPSRTGPHPVVLACDVGGTTIKLGLVCGARLLARADLPAHAQRGLAGAMDRIGRQTGILCREAGVKLGQLAGFGLSFPGIVEPNTERILSTPAGKFDDAKELDVVNVVQRKFGLPLRVRNDANAALAGEWRSGAARGYRSVVMMTLGTGIGTSAIIDGVPLRGRHGQAGCLGGHFTANLNGDACRCGNVGCAESEASTWALPAQAQALPRFSASRLARAKIVDFAAVFQAAAMGDSWALALRDRAIRVWSVTLVSLIHAYDPECAVIGGGIMRNGSILLPRLRRHVARHAWTPWGTVKVKAATLGDDAGLFGVAGLFEDP